MAFVDITGVVDADADGIVFEGKPLERPIIPRFIVPKNLARRLAKLTEGDAVEIENQRRAGNTNIQFDEDKLRSLLGEIDGKPEQLQDARTSRGRVSMRSIRERIPLSEVAGGGADEDDPDYEELDNWRRGQFWLGIREELEQKILSMGDWTPVQKRRIEQQTYLLVNNLKQMREAWQSMGRRERTGLLRRKNIIDGFESHPDIDLTIEDIVNQSELRIHDDGTISLRLPPNKILRSLLPGERDYHNTELPDGKVLEKIIDDIAGRSDAGQWKDLVDSTFKGGNSRNANLAKWPGNGERLPFHDLFTKKYIEQLKTDYRANPENAIMLRANEVAAKLLKYYIIPELEKIKRNKDAKIGGANKNPDEFIHGYLHLLSDPHAWQTVHEEMENRGYSLSPLIVFHDILGHYALGNTFDRHGEWGNILASLSFARDKDFWDRLRQIPGLEDLTKEDREIYLRATLSEVAAAWIQRAIKPPSKVGEINLPSETEIQRIAGYLRNYDGPIDEIIDRLDPPSQQGSMRSTRSISLADASDDDFSKIALDSVEGISIREGRLSSGGLARSLPTPRGLLDRRSERANRSMRSSIAAQEKEWSLQAEQELARQKEIIRKRAEKNYVLQDSIVRLLNSDVMGIIEDDEEAIAAGQPNAREYKEELLRRLSERINLTDNPLAADSATHNTSEYEFQVLESLFVEYGQKVEPLTEGQQQIVIELRDIIRRLEASETGFVRRGGNERSLPFSRISADDFVNSGYAKGWIYPDGSIYPVEDYHSDEHDYAASFEDGLVRLAINRDGVRRGEIRGEVNYWRVEGAIGIEFFDTPTDEAIEAIQKLIDGLSHNTFYVDRKVTTSEPRKMLDESYALTREDVSEMGLKEALTQTSVRSSRSMRSTRSIENDEFIQAKRRRIRERSKQAQNWKEQRKERGLKENAKLLSILDDIDERLDDSDDDNDQEVAKTSRILQSLIDEGALYSSPYVVLGSQRRADLLRLLMEYAPPSPARDTIINDLREVIKGLDVGSRLRRGANPRPMAMQKISVDEFAKSFYWGAWMYPDGTIYPVDRHEMEFDYDDAFDDGMIRIMTGMAGDLTVDANEMTDEQLNALKKLTKLWGATSIFASREQLARRRHGKIEPGTRSIGEMDVYPDTPESEVERLLTTEDFSDTSDFLPSWMRDTSPITTRSTRMVRPKTARKRDIDPEEPLSNKIWDTYEIRQTDDGVHYARGISYQHTRALRNGLISPPMLPFFAPLGGGNNQRTGEGYYFSVTGRRFYGRYGASGALVRRKRKDGTYEYLLARRSPNMSVGAGKWSFPGGAHRDKEDSTLPGITAVDEFMQEVGGDLRGNEAVYSFTDYMAPDWAYDTYVYEVGPKELRKLRPRDGENTDVGWFTANEILEMRDNDQLLPSFARRAQQVMTESGDTGIVSARSVRSAKPDDSVPGEPARISSATNTRDVEAELEELNKSMRSLDARLDAGEITLDEYRKQQIPLRKRSAELGRERAQRTGRTFPQRNTNPQTREDVRPEGAPVARPQQSEEQWDSAAFLEQQRQKQVAFMRGLGFSEEEINVLMSPAQKASSRSRRTQPQQDNRDKPRFVIASSPLFSEVVDVPRTVQRNEALSTFSDGELIDALEIYNIRIPENASGPEDSGTVVPAWFPSANEIILELQSRGYMATRLRMGSARSDRYTDPMFFVSPNPDALPEQIGRRVKLSQAKLPEFVDSETSRTGQAITLRRGREFKDWKLISKLQNMSDDEFRAFGEMLDNDELNMRRRKSSGEVAADEHDAWLNNHTSIRNTYQDVSAQKKLREMVASGERLNVENDPLLTPLDIAVYSRTVPNIRSQRQPHPVLEYMLDEGIVDNSVYDSLANYALMRQQKDAALRNRLSDVLGFDVDSDIRPTLSTAELDMVRGVIDEYDDMYRGNLQSSPLSELTYGQLSALGIDKVDALVMSGEQLPSMRSRRGKKRKSWNVTGEKKITGNMTKLTPEQVRAEQEQRRRAKTIPAKKKKGPDKNEWRQYSVMRSGRPSPERSRYLQDLASNTVGFNQKIIGRPYEPSSTRGQGGFVSFGGDITIGDVLPENYFSSLDFQGDQRYVVMGLTRPSRGVSKVLLRDLKTGSSLGATILDDQQLMNVGRSENMRSSRSRIPAVRAQLLDDFRNLRHDDIQKRTKALLDDFAKVSGQLDELDSQMDDDGFEGSPLERQSNVLDEMQLSIRDDMREIQSTIEYLLAENRQSQIDGLIREKALADARNYTSQDLDGLGLTEDDWKQVMDIVEGSPAETGILFDIPVSGRAKTTSAITLARDIDSMVKEFEKDTQRATEFDGFILDEVLGPEDVDDVEMLDIEEQARLRLRHAYVSVQRNRQLQSAKNAIVNTTATELSSDSIIGLAPVARSSRSGRTLGRSAITSGSGLPNTERIFPGAGSKFANSDISFINMDGNRSEIIVGKKNGSVVRYGGLKADEIREFAYGRSSARQALNDLATNAKYVVDSDGRKRGQVPTLESLLRRDLKRVALADGESGIVRSLIGALTPDEAINSMITDRTPSRAVPLAEDKTPSMAVPLPAIGPEKLHGLVGRLFANGEPAMAKNIMDAADAVAFTNMYRRPAAQLSRKFGDAPTNPLNLSLSADESGIIRDELSRLTKQFQANNDVAAGLKLYDQILESAQSGGMRVQFSISPAQYEQIQQSYEYAYGQRGIGSLSGFTPLEHASMSDKFKFDTSDLGRISGTNSDSLFNNGAPFSMSPSDQSELIEWAKSSNIDIAKQLADNPRLTLNEWNGLKAIRDLSPKSARSANGAGFSRIDTSVGVPLKSAIPPNYRDMSPVEKLVWLNNNSASATNKKGVRKSDIDTEVRNVFAVIDLASKNTSSRNEFESLSGSGSSINMARPSFAKSWDSLSGKSKNVLDAQSQKMFDEEFLNLNPLQAVDVLRSVRPEANKRKTGPLEIDDADMGALWGDAISSSQATLDAVSRRLLDGSISEEVIPEAVTPPRTTTPDVASIDSSLEALLSRASTNQRVTSGSLRQARASSSPDNPLSARQQRANRANKLTLLINAMDNELQELYALRNDDKRHSVIWEDLSKLFQPSDPTEQPDISIGKLNDALDLLDEYISSDVVADALDDRAEGFGPRTTARAKAAVLENIANAEGLKQSLQKLRESYKDDPFIDRTPGRGARLTQVIGKTNKTPRPANRVTQNRIPDVEKYLNARRNEQEAPASMRSQKSGRAEIRAEATRFKELMDSLDVEAQKADDARTKDALLMLKQIMRRQKSALITDKRTNAGAIFLTQSELDEIIEALYVALDRQMGRGSEDRTALFAEMAELMAKAAMATFVNKTVQPVNSRTMTKLNEQGEEVEVALYE